VIFRGRLASTPAVSVVVDGVSMNYFSIQTIKLLLDEDQHDSLILSISGLDPKLVTRMLQRPVFARWTWGANEHTFCGYVYSTHPVNKSVDGQVNRSPLQTTEVVCLGMSAALRGQRVRTWQDVTLPRMVGEFARQYQFSYSIPQDYTVIPRILQSGESDWEVLVRTADFLGFSVNLHGSHLSIWDRNTYLSRRSFYCEALSPTSPRSRQFDRPGYIYELRGDFLPNSVITATGVDITNGDTGRLGPFQRNTGAGKELTTVYTNQRQVNTSTIGLSERMVKGTRKHTYPFKADIHMRGICGVIPGSIVNIKEYDSYYDGFWCVTSVTQSISRDVFTTHVKVVRDSTNESPPRLPPVIKLARPPEPRLVKGSWTSSKQLAEIYA